MQIAIFKGNTKNMLYLEEMLKI